MRLQQEREKRKELKRRIKVLEGKGLTLHPSEIPQMEIP
jgi:hypothetical protein